MDMKITGLTIEVIAQAIQPSPTSATHILEKMLQTIATPRPELSPFAPRLLTIKIDPEMIGLVIGPGGKTIKGITEQTGCKIDIADDGTVTIAAMKVKKREKARKISST